MTTSHQTPAAASRPSPAVAAVGPPSPSRVAHIRDGEGSLAPGMAKLAAAMSESDLDRKVQQIARGLGLLVYHTFDSRRSAPGWPDLTIVGRSVLYRELKRENGRLTTAQRAWLAALGDAGQDAGVWRPSDLLSGRVARELAALAGIGAR